MTFSVEILPPAALIAFVSAIVAMHRNRALQNRRRVRAVVQSLPGRLDCINFGIGSR